MGSLKVNKHSSDTNKPLTEVINCEIESDHAKKKLSMHIHHRGGTTHIMFSVSDVMVTLQFSR